MLQEFDEGFTIDFYVRGGGQLNYRYSSSKLHEQKINHHFNESRENVHLKLKRVRTFIEGSLEVNSHIINPVKIASWKSQGRELPKSVPFSLTAKASDRHRDRHKDITKYSNRSLFWLFHQDLFHELIPESAREQEENDSRANKTASQLCLCLMFPRKQGR